MVQAHAQPNCVFCGYLEAPVHMHRPRFEIRRCPHCMVLWCDPTRFDEDFNPDNEAAYLEVEATIHTENAARLQQLSRVAPPSSHPRLLEVGCMHGDFIYQARGAGYDASGADLSATAVEEANRRMPGAVRLATLDESYEANSLDVVAAFNVVEHMDRPDAFLAQVLRVLRPGGVFIAETPAQESVYHHVLFLRGRVQSQGAFEVGIHPGTHIFKFGRRAWKIVLGDLGFDVLDIEPRSTPMRELLAKNKSDPILRAGIVGFGLLGRATGWENRVLVTARRR
ncbi:3-demethylubiquinone-9 3-methyltransferase-like protein [Enhygromyxa salina]|uniref:3-demethylubiquinone-9 3-methyltransferase-like protein n=1 Tax=Enhygromyxa salina TaxID=215803 RepID=A0A0C1Z3J2_9BACT|nr:class I SAM-dependent methyltransferase [Enhygromyxa salina]KIG12159.1 3-demethylubiquinone-9 3-methyltransferase-like protein [Enhygromyxa salina]